MAVKVTVNSSSPNRVSINNQQRTTIRTVGIAAQEANIINRIVNLVDVDATSLDNNETLVYDEATDKFVVKELPNINGGTF
jgi:hypothetical protein